MALNGDASPENPEERSTGAALKESENVISTTNDNVPEEGTAFGEKAKALTAGAISTAEKDNTTEPLQKVESAENYPKGIKLVLLLLAIYLSIFLVALDRTIISTALPRITDEFHSFDDVGWYNGAFTMTTCAFQLFFGRVYTFYSPKWIFIGLTVVFEIGSAICGAAPNSVAFIWGRAIAGLGAAGLFNGANVLMIYAAPLHKRSLYAGLIAAVFGVASVAGPPLGGVFTQSVTWRWCFYLNLPIGGLVLAFLVLVVPNTPPVQGNLTLKQKLTRLDLPGTAILLPVIVCLLLALQWGGQTYPWSDGRIIALFVVAGVLLIVFAGIQVWQGESATLPPRILKQRTILASAWFCFFLGSTFLIPVYYISIWFQAIKGDSPIISGVSLLPLLLGLVISSITTGALVMRLGPFKPAMIVSAILLPIATGLFCLFTTTTGHSMWIGVQFFFGFAIGCGFQQPNIAAQSVLAKADLPTGISLIFFVQLFGPTIFVAVAQNILDNHLVSELAGKTGLTPQDIVNTGATALRDIFPAQFLPRVLEVYNEGIKDVFYLATALSCLAIFGALTVENKSVKKAQKPKAEEAEPEAEGHSEEVELEEAKDENTTEKTDPANRV